MWRGPQQAAVADGFKFGIKLIFDTFRNKFPAFAMIPNKLRLLFENKIEGRGLIRRRFLNTDDLKVFM